MGAPLCAILLACGGKSRDDNVPPAPVNGCWPEKLIVWREFLTRTSAPREAEVVVGRRTKRAARRAAVKWGARASWASARKCSTRRHVAERCDLTAVTEICARPFDVRKRWFAMEVLRPDDENLNSSRFPRFRSIYADLSDAGLLPKPLDESVVIRRYFCKPGFGVVADRSEEDSFAKRPPTDRQQNRDRAANEQSAEGMLRSVSHRYSYGFFFARSRSAS